MNTGMVAARRYRGGGEIAELPNAVNVLSCCSSTCINTIIMVPLNRPESEIVYKKMLT